jgi:hypothetical protein
VAAEAITGKMLLFGAPDDVRPRAAWEGSAAAAGHDAVAPILTSAALAPAAAFAVFAVMVPVLVRGRSLALDILGATIWACALPYAVGALPFLPNPNGAVAGAAVGGALAVAAREAGLVPLPGRRPAVP